MQVRFYKVDDFVKELKDGGHMESRLEVERKFTSEGAFVDYNLVLTGLGRNNVVLRFELPLAEKVFRIPEIMQKVEEDLAKYVDKFKLDLKEKESLNFKAGIYSAR